MGALILVIWVISRKEAQGSGKVPACSNLMPGNELSIGGKTKAYNMCHITVVFPQYKMVAATHASAYLGPLFWSGHTAD